MTTAELDALIPGWAGLSPMALRWAIGALPARTRAAVRVALAAPASPAPVSRKLTRIKTSKE